MIYIALGCLGSLIVQIFNIISIKGIPRVKPVIWAAGSALFIYSIVMLALQPDTLPLPGWAAWPGWLIFSLASALSAYSLFINIPFRKTYLASGNSGKLVTTGFYALVRHPWMLCLVVILFSLVLITRSQLLLIAALVYTVWNITLVFLQDRFVFGKMFAEYGSYRKMTPMLVPNRQSIAAFIESFRQAGTCKSDFNG
jgi:protein-S-isoprenylcysteine O-methyltransferase Ste14